MVESSRYVGEVARRLNKEFAGLLDSTTVEGILDEQVLRWADAPVQAFVPVLAERYARQRLRELTSQAG